MQDLAQQPGQQRDKGHADQGNTTARDELLNTLRLCLCVIKKQLKCKKFCRSYPTLGHCVG